MIVLQIVHHHLLPNRIEKEGSTAEVVAHLVCEQYLTGHCLLRIALW